MQVFSVFVVFSGVQVNQGKSQMIIAGVSKNAKEKLLKLTRFT